jgi:hypothetical protein
MEEIKKYKYNGESKIVSIESTNLKKSLESKRLIFNKFEFLNRKMELVDKASKLNNLNFISRDSKNSGFVKAMVQYDMLYNYFMLSTPIDKCKLDNAMVQINNLLEDTINEIEKVDYIKRTDPNYCRLGINYGREHIEKALIFIFGFYTYF